MNTKQFEKNKISINTELAEKHPGCYLEWHNPMNFALHLPEDTENTQQVKDTVDLLMNKYGGEGAWFGDNK